MGYNVPLLSALFSYHDDLFARKEGAQLIAKIESKRYTKDRYKQKERNVNRTI